MQHRPPAPVAMGIDEIIDGVSSPACDSAS
jgi:hypothetical protein